MPYNRYKMVPMMESHTADPLSIWKTPECPFEIAYDSEVLDNIRLAVVDAFFSLPRGGAEIGGILLGAHTPETVTITAYEPLDCEHATGPSFTLSANDHVHLVDLLMAAQGRGQEVVGWYHSHTRSEICLNSADCDVHGQYFREPWQVALVMKPSTFNPARCGFFFREADGTFRSESSYLEFALEPATARPAPVRGDLSDEYPVAVPVPSRVPVAEETPAPPKPVTAPPVPEASVPAIPALETRVEPSSPESPAAPPKPVFTEAPEPQISGRVPLQGIVPPARPRAWMYSMMATVVVAGGIYQTRDKWMGSPTPQAVAHAKPAPIAAQSPVRPATIKPSSLPVTSTGVPANAAGGAAAVPPPAQPSAAKPAGEMQTANVTPLTQPATQPTGARSAPPGPVKPTALPGLGLVATDTGGQVRVQWDRSSTTILQASRGILEFFDGKHKRAIPLDRARLRTGSFTYVRQSEQVDVRLTVESAGKQTSREMTTILGKLPQRSAEDAAAKKQREAIALESTRLKAELRSQAARTRALEKTVEDLKKQVQIDRQRRQSNIVPDRR